MTNVEPLAVEDSAVAASCPACGRSSTGIYCSTCGERAPQVDDERLVPFLRDSVREVLSFDGRLWRTIGALFVPGMLTEAYLSGRRSRYLKPVRVFLLVNLAFFLALSGANSGSIFRGSLAYQSGAPFYGSVAERSASEQQARWGAGATRYEIAFNRKADSLAPTLMALWVPILALLFAVALAPLRASGVRHLVLATHSVAAMMAASFILLLVVVIALSLASSLGVLPWADGRVDGVLVPLNIFAIVLYLVLAIRRVYSAPWWGAGLVGIMIGTVGIVAIVLTFRAALFFVTLATLDPPV